MGPSEALIYHAHLRHNLQLIRRQVGRREIMAVIKANAYGHDMIPCAKTLLEAGADSFGVAFAEEGVALRAAGFSCPILVFGAQLPQQLKTHLEHSLQVTVTAVEQVEHLQRLAGEMKTTAEVWLKYDSGMNRVGMYDDQLPAALQKVSQSGQVRLAGVYSHLSSADEDDEAYTRLQIKRFEAMRRLVLDAGFKEARFSLANSAGIMRYPQSWYNCVRPGVMLYGNPPAASFKTDAKKWPLKEVMQLRSAVALVKNVAAGEPLSYNRRFQTQRPARIALVPIGYGDGYDRRWTNRGVVLIRGKRFSVRGTVCMDQILVDITDAPEINKGDEVILFGKQDKEAIRIADFAAELNTIPYEVTCSVSQRIPRRHIFE